MRHCSHNISVSGVGLLKTAARTRFSQEIWFGSQYVLMKEGMQIMASQCSWIGGYRSGGCKNSSVQCGEKAGQCLREEEGEGGLASSVYQRVLPPVYKQTHPTLTFTHLSYQHRSQGSFIFATSSQNLSFWCPLPSKLKLSCCRVFMHLTLSVTQSAIPI